MGLRDPRDSSKVLETSVTDWADVVSGLFEDRFMHTTLT